MTNVPQHRESISLLCAAKTALAFCSIGVLGVALSQPLSAQTFTLLHTFTGGGDGGIPGGLVMDRAGNLYGATVTGGLNGAGTVFKLKQTGSGWVLNPLYEFSRSNGDLGPDDAVILGPDGNVYGAVGTQNGYGAIFKLQPPPSACRTSLCYWTETHLYSFGDAPDGHAPNGNLVFDSAGNIYGTTEFGGTFGYGSIFKLSPAGGGWTESVLYSFMGGDDGDQPIDGVVMDGTGNLYGTTRFGGVPSCNDGCGTVFELSPSGGGWTEQILYRFPGFAGGYEPRVSVILDSAGNLYGTTYNGGDGSGTVFELSPAGGGAWNYSMLYDLAGNGGGSESRLAMDSAGNLYGTFWLGPTLFKLSHSGGGWTYTDLHDFSDHDGNEPGGNLAIDSQGNVYGTCAAEGQDLYGTAWQVTP